MPAFLRHLAQRLFGRSVSQPRATQASAAAAERVDSVVERVTLDRGSLEAEFEAGENTVYTFSVRGNDALETWTRIRAITAETHYWPGHHRRGGQRRGTPCESGGPE